MCSKTTLLFQKTHITWLLLLAKKLASSDIKIAALIYEKIKNEINLKYTDV